eukprot:1247587-Amphidinium_carterae.1
MGCVFMFHAGWILPKCKTVLTHHVPMELKMAWSSMLQSLPCLTLVESGGTARDFVEAKRELLRLKQNLKLSILCEFYQLFREGAGWRPVAIVSSSTMVSCCT